MNNQDEGNWNGGNFRIYIAQITGKCIREFPQRNLSPSIKVLHALGGETLGLWCMQEDVHNTLFSWHVMFEEININFMNPHDNEIM